MFRAMSWIRRTGVAVALLASLCTGVVALPHAEGLDDVACSPVFVSHDESAHYIGVAPSSPAGEVEHCFLCHSLRSFHPVFDKYELRDGTSRAERLHATLVAGDSRLDWALVPGRAPPV